MKIPVLALLLAFTYLGVVLLIDDYVDLRQQVAYIKAEQKRDRAGEMRHGQEVVPPVAAQRAPNSNTKQGEKEAKETLWTIQGITSKAAEYLMLIVTFGALCFTGGLLLVEVRGKRHELRAYVLVRRAWIKREVDGVIWATVDVHNFGQTPAYDVVQWVAIQPVYNTEETTFKKPPGPDFPVARGITGPGGNTLLPTPTSGPVPDVFYIAMQQDKAKVFIWGEVRYVDIFKKPHFTRFRMFAGGEGTTEGHVMHCEEGNEAD